MLDTAYAWAPITKMEKDSDGTLLVYGPAASPDLDRDQQRLNPEWLGKAMPAWFEQGANVREQHDGRRAVGVGVGLSKTDTDVHMLAARIVDPVAVSKCEHGVLKGFSVGIKNPKVTMGKADAPGGEIVDGDIIEVSVVDRPCNPTTLFEIAKADGTDGDLIAVEDATVTEKTDAEAFGLPQELYDRLAAPVKDALTSLASGGAAVHAEAAKSDTPDSPEAPALPVVINVTIAGQTLSEDDLLDAIAKADLSAAGRRKAAASGAAMQDGSYPIETKSDLRKAIKAVGRGGADHDKIRAHIIKRAKALGLSDMIPDDWKADGSMTTTKADEATIAKAQQILADLRPMAPGLDKADAGAAGADGPDESADIKGSQEALAAIAKLIVAEAESLAEGNVNEIIDISMLLDAARSLKWFQDREEREQAGMADDMCLADQPDTAKSDTASPAPEDGTVTPPADDAAKTDEGALLTKAEAEAAVQAAVTEALAALTPQTTPDPAPETVTKAELAEMVKTAVAEATAAAQERTEALAADLAKATSDLDAIKKMPTPGGPALTRTAVQQAEATKSDASRLRAEATDLLEKAERFAANRDLAQGYRERARDLLAKADA